MPRSARISLATLLAIGFAGPANAQFMTGSCPSAITDWLQDPALGGQPAGIGEGPSDCQYWRYGLGPGSDGDSTELIFRFSADPFTAPQLCGAEEPAQAAGQLILVEPVDAVCDTDTAPGNRCPVYSPPDPDGTPLDLVSFAFLEQFSFLAGGAIIINAKAHLRFGDTLGVREALGASGGGTVVHWDADLNPLTPDSLSTRLNTHGNPNDPVNPTGDTLCCDSTPDFICEIQLGDSDLDIGGLTIPFSLGPDVRSATPDLIFNGNKGSSFSSDPDYVVPGQIQGICDDEFRGDLSNFTPCAADTDCPGSVACDKRDLGFRVSDNDLIAGPEGFPNDAVCNHVSGDLHGQAVDQVVNGTSFSTGCSQVFFRAMNVTPADGCIGDDFGSFIMADTDCDGILDVNDNCIFAPNPGQEDASSDGRGNACECGDQSGDGFLNITDILEINSAIFGLQPVAPLCDANNDGACNIGDILGVNFAIFNPLTTTCAQLLGP